jgi:hypothetical protein
MKTKRSRLGLSILAGGLSFVGSANAVDLIVNGSFENPNAGEWKYFNTYNYSQAYFTGPPVPASEGPGSIWSWQHGSAYGAWANFVTPTNEVDHLQYNLQFADSQTVNLTNALVGTAIDAGLGHYTFSSWLASYGQPGSNPEQPYVVLGFFDSGGTAQVGENVIFDRVNNVNAVMYADGNTSIPADLSSDHNWIKYVATGTVPATARKATVYITRSPNAGLSGTPDTYVDLVKLDVFNVNDTTVFYSSSPPNGQTSVSPDATVTVTLRDISTQVNTNSIKFLFDNVPATPSVQKAGSFTTVQYDPPGLMGALSSHTCAVVWSDKGETVTTKTNQFAFTVAPYVNIDLGPPLYVETFDELSEGLLPAGWSVTNFTDLDTAPGYDLNNFHSDTFLDWTVVSRSTMSNWFTVTPGGGDFTSIFNVAPNQVINDAVVTNLVSSNSIIAISDRTSPSQKQIDYLFTRDYNLSGKTNVYVSFHNIYIQNQNNIASVEYSINGGATWLPALYLLDRLDILFDNAGNIDASNTFATVHADVPNIDLNSTANGYYGQYIGVKSNLWSTLAPFIGARVDDDQTGSKRVEVIRLAQADNQPAVRFRMALAGRWSWYFGIDDFGIYSITSADPPLLANGPTPATQTVAVGNSTMLVIDSAYGLGPLTYQWRQNGTNLPGKTAQILYFPNVSLSAAGTYDVVVTGAGGSVTSPPPAAVLTVINPPVFVTGQWDFLSNNLAASYGADLQFHDAGVQGDTTFGTTISFGIPDINGVPTPVMHFIPSTAQWGGYVMYHGAEPNGGGAYVNQYTLVFDMYYPPSSDGVWRSLWQTSLGNSNDGDLFVGNSSSYPSPDGLGISSIYDGYVSAGAWHRIAAAFDLTGPGSPVLTKFIDGVKVGNQTSGLSGQDGRFSLDPSALVFADNDGDVAEAFVSSIQFSNGRRPDAFLEALGGPSPLKIPGIIRAEMVSGRVVIRWSGGVALQSADSLAGPWTTVPGTAGQSSYTPSPLNQNKFYRPQIP